MATKSYIKVIVLTYKSNIKTETFSGIIEGVVDAQVPTTFTDLTYGEMMGIVGAALRISPPDYRLVIKREGTPYPMALPPGIEDLLRNNMSKAIETLTQPPCHIDLRSAKKRQSSELLLGEIRHGFDALADSIGEEVYIKLRNRQYSTQAEDPETGRWVDLDFTTGKMPSCGKLLLQSKIFSGPAHWGTVLTTDLIALGLGRYWLPRRWNPSLGWITHDSLVTTYESYKKEKADVSR